LSLRKLLFAAALAAAVAPAVSRADTLAPVAIGGSLVLSQGWFSTVPGQSPTTVTGNGINDGTAPVAISNVTGNGPGTYIFSQTFINPNGSFPAANQINGQNYGFIASYVVDLPSAMASSFVFSLGMTSTTGLENLTARLYAYNAVINSTAIQNLTVGNPGPPANGGLILGWSASSNGTLASTQLPQTTVGAGWYVLQLAGIETGSSNGTYSGQLDVTPVAPVPIPATLPLLLSGCAGLVALIRRRRAA
jgi:hypothetical protein